MLCESWGLLRVWLDGMSSNRTIVSTVFLRGWFAEGSGLAEQYMDRCNGMCGYHL